jgi:hypothetical protein
MRRRAAPAVVVLALGLGLGARRASAADAPPPVSPDAGVVPDGGAAEEARAQSDATAALRATQDLEARMIELRRQLDGLERQRASFEDLRGRLDAMEAKQAAARASDGDWTSSNRDADGLRVGPGGYSIRSPGERFLLRPGLRLQSLYEGRIAGAGPADAARMDSSTVSLAHAQLIFEGHAFTKRLEFRFELDFADVVGFGRNVVKDAFVQWRFGGSTALRAGQFKVPYGLQTQFWSGYLELVDVAQATAAFSLDRDVGLMLVGRPFEGKVQYRLAALNGPRGACPGASEGLQCDRVDLGYAGRLAVAPFGPLPVAEGDVVGQQRPLLQVGVSGAYALRPTDVRARSGASAAPLDVDHDGRVDNVGVFQAGADLRALFRGASLQGEYFLRREHPGAGLPDRTYWGAYGQASYFVLPRRLQVAARFGQSDLPLYGASVTERSARGSRTTEQAVAVSAYLAGHDAKLQVDYTHLASDDALSAPTVDRIRAAVQLAF